MWSRSLVRDAITAAGPVRAAAVLLLPNGSSRTGGVSPRLTRQIEDVSVSTRFRQDGSWHSHVSTVAARRRGRTSRRTSHKRLSMHVISFVGSLSINLCPRLS